MRWSFVLGMGLTLLWPILSRDGRAQSAGVPGVAREEQADRSKTGLLKPYGTRDMRTFAAQKQAYSRPSPASPPVDKRSRAAVFAKGVRDYYPTARANQSKNSNVIDPRSLCVPGRRALLQR